MKNLVISLGIQLINIILLIINRLVFSNFLGVEEFGLFTTLSLYCNLFVLLGSMGLGHSLSYMVNNNLIKRDYIYSYVARITISTSLILIPLGYIYLTNIYPNILLIYIILILISVPFLIFINIMIYSFLKDGNTITFFVFNSLHLFFSILFYLILDKDLLYAFIGWTIGSIASFVILHFYLLNINTKISLNSIYTSGFNYIKYGVKIFVNTVINTVNARLVIFLASIILSFEHVAILSITILIADLFNKIFHTLSLIIMSKNSQEVLFKYLFISLALAVFGMLTLYLFGAKIITLFFPEEYIISLNYFWIIIPYIIFNGVYGLYYHYLVKQDKAHYGIVASITTLLSLLILGNLLTYRYEVSGLLHSLNISSLLGLVMLLTTSLLHRKRGGKR